MVDVADAYMDKIVITSFAKRVNNASAELKPIVQRLCTLYGLDIIQENKGWYLENDYMEGAKTKAIRKVRSKVLQDLRPDVRGLVDAFGIPEELIAAPIAL